MKQNKGTKSPFLKDVAPMLATLTGKPFNDEEWQYEVKFDGYRIIAEKNKSVVVLRSRGSQNYTKKYQAVSDAVKELNHNLILDGEIVVVDKEQRPHFNMLQNYRAGDPVRFYVFDILWLDGYDLTKLPLTQRRDILEAVIPENEIIKFSPAFEDGIALFDLMKQREMEGIVAKRKDSIYLVGKRTQSWLKVPIMERTEFIIGGWVESGSGRSYKSLLLGKYVDGKLHYIHHSGSGLNEVGNKKLIERLKKIETKKNPFANNIDVKYDTPLHWVKAVLVGDFKKSNKTSPTGKIRHPVVLMGIREDKNASEVIVESKTPDESKLVPASMAKSQNIIKIEGRTIELIDIEHEYWKGITKADVIRYYIKASAFILPYLKDRPLALNIVKGMAVEGGEFVRNVNGLLPKWIKTFKTDRKHLKAGKSKTIDWLVCNDLATLIYMVNMGSIDIHPWSSRIASPNEPDYISIDLDPSDDDFSKVIKTAVAAKQLFARCKLQSFVKTSGKTGLHIFLPCKGIQFGEARTIAENICAEIHNLLPSITTTATSVNSRGNKLYIDPSQNDYSDRLAVAYCVRAYKSPAISMPLDWKDVNAKLDPGRFKINTVDLDKLKESGINKLYPRLAVLKANTAALRTFLVSKIK